MERIGCLAQGGVGALKLLGIRLGCPMSSGGDSGRLAQGGTGGVKVVVGIMVGIRLGCPR